LSVKLFEQGLCAECFMRIHKSYIININHVKEINYNRAIMSNGKKIPIGEIFRKQFYDFINKNIIKR
ncbi:MAG: LytTR family transcriptional regulator, partial [Tidjanibacter sp.]|nr:LytTR family transcriptional regulator [Tidjanibacter sp.]